jgi:hypothetical protein
MNAGQRLTRHEFTNPEYFRPVIRGLCVDSRLLFSVHLLESEANGFVMFRSRVSCDAAACTNYAALTNLLLDENSGESYAEANPCRKKNMYNDPRLERSC